MAPALLQYCYVFWAARVRVCVLWVCGCVCDTRVEVTLRLHAHSANMGVCEGERAAGTTGHKNCNVYD